MPMTDATRARRPLVFTRIWRGPPQKRTLLMAKKTGADHTVTPAERATLAAYRRAQAAQTAHTRRNDALRAARRDTPAQLDAWNNSRDGRSDFQTLHDTWHIDGLGAPRLRPAFVRYLDNIAAEGGVGSGSEDRRDKVLAALRGLHTTHPIEAQALELRYGEDAQSLRTLAVTLKVSYGRARELVQCGLRYVEAAVSPPLPLAPAENAGAYDHIVPIVTATAP